MPILKDFKYHAPDSLKEALQLLQKSPKPMLLAGGTFALNTLKKTAASPEDVITLRKIAELKGIRREKGAVAIGAMTSLDEVVSSPLVQEGAPVLAEACSKVATTPIRYMATIGGNIASRFYWVDLPAVLMALDARLEWIAAGGSRKQGELADFLKDHKTKGILTRVFVPPQGSLSVYFRHTQTMDVDVPVLALVFSAGLQAQTLKDVRVCVNTTMAFPQRLRKLEALWQGRKPGLLNAEEARLAMRQDLSTVKLDEYRLSLLDADLDSVIEKIGKAA